MPGWVPTAALARAVLVTAVGLAGAVILGDPVIVVLAAPFTAYAVLALVLRPRRTPRVSLRLDHTTLYEGQGTTSRLLLADHDDVEHATRLSGQSAYVALHPVHGLLSAVVRPSPQDAESGVAALALGVGPRRWGRRRTPQQRVVLWSPWAGFRSQTVVVGESIRTLPVAPPFGTRSDLPQPSGLVGAHRSRRPGSGTELAGIRPFTVGDRLRRIDWRTSLRTGDLHVVETRAEQDSAVLLLLDALADHGRSEGIDGAASSLDVGVRAASALTEHFTRHGDRVGLWVLNRTGMRVGYGTGRTHQLRVQETLLTVVPGAPEDLSELRLHAPAGTVVVVLSPMLDEVVVAAAATLMQRGLSVLVVDTLPASVVPGVGDAVPPDVAALAWRMRRAERADVLDRLARAGCPVVEWRGPGTLDEVLVRLARRAQVPRVGSGTVAR